MALVLRGMVRSFQAFYQLGEGMITLKMGKMFGKASIELMGFVSVLPADENGTVPLILQPQLYLAVFLVYLWVVKDIGPRLMKDREPFNLRSVLLTYNAMQVAFNTYIWVLVSYFIIFLCIWSVC